MHVVCEHRLVFRLLSILQTMVLVGKGMFVKKIDLLWEADWIKMFLSVVN